MDNLDGSKKESTVLVNDGFDDQEASHTPVSRAKGGIDNSQDRLSFDPGILNKIFHHSQKEHPVISKIAKFSGEMFKMRYSPANSFAKQSYETRRNGQVSSLYTFNI